MGWFGSSQKTTEKATYAPLSARGEEYDALFTEMLIETLREFGGYDITSTQKTKWADESKANALQDQIASLQSDIEAARSRIEQSQAAVSSSTSVKFQDPYTARRATSADEAEIKRLQRQIDLKREELGNIPKVTYNDFDLVKREDPRVLQAIERYGADSQEVTAIRNQLKADEIDAIVAEENIQKTFLKNLQKFTNGDYSYTPEQAAQVDQFIGPVKNVLNASIDRLIGMSEQLGADLGLELDNLVTEIDKTGIDVLDALKAAEVQYEQSGATLMESVRRANESSYNRAKFEFDLLSRQADQQAAQQGALLGLPPGSMAERTMAAQMKTDALRMLELDAAERDANAAFQIEGMTQEGKQKISLSRVALAEAQGGKKEEVGRYRFNLASALKDEKFGLERGREDALLQLEQARQGELKNVALGGLPALINAGAGGLGFLQDQRSVGQANAMGLLAPVTQQLGVEQARQANEATRTSETKKGASFLDAFTGILGTTAGAVGAGFSLAGSAQRLGAGVASSASSMLAQPSSPYNLGNYGSQLRI